MKQALFVMLEMQDQMNTKVHPNWRDQRNEWYRAIWVECAELLDHYGWKWWKKQSPDIEQVNLELIDIWHFGLSIVLEQSKGAGPTDLDDIADSIADGFESPQLYDDFRLAVEDFALVTLSTRAFDVKRFSGLIKTAGLSFEQLYAGYVGKNVLNFFRQDNGYKDGSYKKIWQGKEDNEHLVEVLASLPNDSPRFKTDVYSALEERYSKS